MRKLISVFVFLFLLSFNSYAQQVSSDISSLLSSEGKVLYGEEPNSIVVTDYPENLQRVSEYLDVLDVPPQQVLIEARVIEVVLQDQNALGINWNVLASHQGLQIGGYRVTSAGSNTIDQNIPSLPVYPKPGDPNSSLKALGGGLDPFTLTVFNNDITAVLSAMASSLNTDVLSAPRVVTVNNRPADIRIIQSYPWAEPQVSLSDSGATTVTWTVHFEEIGIILRVTPTINPDGNISMILNPDISEFVSVKTLSLKTGPLATDVLTYDIPIIDKRTASTKVIVGTGQTLIFGGLIKNKMVQNDIKVPFMGNLPILGPLFRTRNTVKEKTELLILVSPTVINSSEVARMGKEVKYGANHQYVLDQERREKMALVLENKETQNRANLSTEWESLLKKQDELSATAKRLEEAVSSEENNLKNLEAEKSALISRKNP